MSFTNYANKLHQSNKKSGGLLAQKINIHINLAKLNRLLLFTH
jgi:hypothetical protein